MRRVLIGDFGPILRLGIADVLAEEEYELVAEDSRHAPLMDRLVETHPEAVLLDLDGPQGAELANTIGRDYPAIKLIGISSATRSIKAFASSHQAEASTTELNPEQLIQALAER